MFQGAVSVLSGSKHFHCHVHPEGCCVSWCLRLVRVLSLCFPYLFLFTDTIYICIWYVYIYIYILFICNICNCSPFWYCCCFFTVVDVAAVATVMLRSEDVETSTFFSPQLVRDSRICTTKTWMWYLKWRWCKSFKAVDSIFTWNPNDPCFGWKRPCFEGFTFKHRGQLGPRYF